MNLSENLYIDKEIFSSESLEENEVLINNIIEDINNENIIKIEVKPTSYINKEYILNESELTNILTDNINTKYNLDDLKYIFSKFSEAIIIIQIINGEITFNEKKGFESRNQSVIDLLIKTNNYKKLPNIQFIIFTNDFIKNQQLTQYKYLLTFCKKYSYETVLFPNFNFNHWLEAKIDNYETVYDNFTNNQILWKNKKSTVFWSGSNTNIIREKISTASKKHDNYYINLLNKNSNNNNYILIEEITKYKYLLNMNGYSYAARLNYLFLSGSCVIILKNDDKEKDYEEFFYKEFIPNEDYIEIMYNDSENEDNIINRINDAIKNKNCELMALKCYEKAKQVFQINNIYDNIYNTILKLSDYNVIDSQLQRTICHTPDLNYFYKNRLKVVLNTISFNFIGKNIELKMIQNNDVITIKIINNNTEILYNDTSILFKYTPFLLNENKSQNYTILINKNQLTLLIEKKFNLIKCELPVDNFIILETEIKTENGDGWWVI